MEVEEPTQLSRREGLASHKPTYLESKISLDVCINDEY
jgi:hypothetical protein